MKVNAKRYLIASLIGLIATALLALFNGFSLQEQRSEAYRILSDAFLTSGIFFFSLGGILFASNGGLFDMLLFGVATFFDARKREGRKRKYKDFYEYKRSKEKRKTSYFYLLVIGGALLLIATIFALLWSN